MENIQNYLIFLVIAFSSGLAIGAGIVWLYARARIKTEMQLEDKFKVLASDTLNATNESFLQLAATRFETSEKETSATLEQKVIAIDETVKPVKDLIQTMNEHLRALEVKREVAYGELMQIANLSMRGT